jgi:glycosidase
MASSFCADARFVALASLLAACAGHSRVAMPSAARPAPAPPRVVYLVVTDRFANGDRTNDDAVGRGCFDPADPSKIHGGDLAGLRQRIAYLEELGVSTVWILPVVAQSPDRCGYHGYWADFADPDDAAIAPNLGTRSDLEALLLDLHARRMGLMLDMVVNHAGPHARIVAEHPDWFHDARTCNERGNPEEDCPIGGKPLPDFAQEKPEVASYLTRTSLGWATRLPIDAIRMDTVKHVPVPYWRSWTDALRAARPEVFTVGEVFHTGGASKLGPYLDAGFDSLFNYPLYAAIVAAFAKRGSVDALAAKIEEEIATLGEARVRRLTSFVANHDNPRFPSLAAAADEEEIARRHRLALGAIFTLPGIPQLYYGDELALYGAKDPDNRRDMPEWAFREGGRASPHPGEAAGRAETTFAYVRALARLRVSHPELRDGRYTELWRPRGSAANVFVFARGERIVVAINGGTEPASVTVPVRAAALDRLLGEGTATKIDVAAGKATLSIPPLAMVVYTLAP